LLLQAADTFRLTGMEGMGPGVRRDDAGDVIRYLVSAGSGVCKVVIARSVATKQSSACFAFWIASRSLSSGARSRDPLARNDDLG